MQKVKSRYTTREMSQIAIFAAVTAVLTQVVIPIQPVPISFGIFAVMLSAVVLPLKLSFTAQLVYLLLGAFGAPVFTNFQGGFQKIIGPTGGYLIGYLALVLVAGLLRGKFPRAGVVATSAILILAFLTCYAFGTLWLAIGLGYSFGQAFMIGAAPFIVLDILKSIAAAAIGIRLRNILGRA